MTPFEFEQFCRARDMAQAKIVLADLLYHIHRPMKAARFEEIQKIVESHAFSFVCDAAAVDWHITRDAFRVELRRAEAAGRVRMRPGRAVVRQAKTAGVSPRKWLLAAGGTA